MAFAVISKTKILLSPTHETVQFLSRRVALQQQSVKNFCYFYLFVIFLMFFSTLTVTLWGGKEDYKDRD